MLLAALVAGGAVAAPFFVYAATERLTVRVIAAAPSTERDVAISHDVNLRAGGEAGLAQAEASIARVLVLPDFTGLTSIRVIGTSGPDSEPALAEINARDGVCGQVTVTGRCPSAAGETMVSSATLRLYKLHIGGVVTFASTTIKKPVKLQIVGVYQPRDPADPYWGQSSLAAQLGPTAGEGIAAVDSFFVTPATIIATNSTDIVVDRDLILQPQALSVHAGLADNTAISDSVTRLRPAGYRVSFAFTNLVNRIVFDTNQIFTAVALGAVEVVLFGWFALFLAIRATAVARRFDVGILKLRGVQRRKLWTLMTEQSLLPLLAGAPVGLVGGFIGARLIAGSVRASGDIRLAGLLALGGVVVTVLGGLGAALIAERQALATPVGDLLRNTPSRRRGWRTDVVDLLLVLLAIAGVIEIRTSAAGSGSTIAILAPGLIAFALGLVTARLLVPLSSRAAVTARRKGRVRALLTHTYLARRPGLDRLFALLAIAVALCGYALLASGTASAARANRATLEVGAARVLTVNPVTPRHLLTAVRAADPSGRYAMAVTQITAGGSVGVLAVDSTRLAAVLPPGSSDDGAVLAAELHPTPSHEIIVTGSSVQLDVDASNLPLGHTAYLVASMMGTDGPVLASFGPLRYDTTTYVASTPACTASRTCELIGFGLSNVPHPVSPLANSAAPGTAAQLIEFWQAGPARELLEPADMASELRWRTTIAVNGVGPTIETSPQGMSIEVPAAGYLKTATLDSTAYLVTVPDPVPVVEAGAVLRPAAPGVLEVSPFGFNDVPVVVAGSTSLLPRLEGSGVLIDLDYAQALAGPDTTGVTPQVWLAPATPPAVLTALARAGITPIQSQSVTAQAATYADEPVVVGLRFQIVAGFVGIAIAAVALLLVGSVERRPRARDLVALRHQGVTAKAARSVVIRGYLILAGGAGLVGVVGAVVDRLLAGATPLFSDGWHVLPRPPSLPLSGLLAEVVTTVVALGLGAVIATYQLTRTIEIQTKESV